MPVINNKQMRKNYKLLLKMVKQNIKMNDVNEKHYNIVRFGLGRCAGHTTIIRESIESGFNGAMFNSVAILNDGRTASEFLSSLDLDFIAYDDCVFTFDNFVKKSKISSEIEFIFIDDSMHSLIKSNKKLRNFIQDEHYDSIYPKLKCIIIMQ